MSAYMTEEDQWEAIKKWWNKYSNLITTILALLLFIIAGFKYWNWHEAKDKVGASNAYEHLMVAFANQDNQSVQSYANQLINDYNQSVYADAARLILAKLFIADDDYKKAKEALDYVANHSHMQALKQVATIRIARLLVAEKKYDKALAKLTNVIDTAYMPVINELKGDIFTARGQYQQALFSYKEAITGARTHGIGNTFLELKTSELAALTHSMNKNDGAVQAA
jgi:predicted negative regulator of RcsB-dependent stress response